jgi:hypothetical protein
LLARVNGRAMTARQIGKAGGLHPSTVHILSEMDSFAHVTISTASKYLVGCGIDVFHLRRQWEFIKRQEKNKRGMAHIRRAKRPSYFKRLAKT